MTLAPPVGAQRAVRPPGAAKGPETYNAALIQLFRQIMQNARDADETIDALTKSIAVNRAERAQAIDRELAQYARNSAQLDEQIQRAKDLADEDPAFDVGDQVTLIEDAWSRAKDLIPSADALRVVTVPPSVATDLVAAKSFVRKLHFYAARLSAPSQVREYVDELRPGQSASIHNILMEDIPDKAQRDELVQYIKTAHISIPGIINVNTGIVTRYETNKTALRISMFRILLLALGIPILALVASRLWASFPQLNSIATPEQVSTFFPIIMG